MSKIKNKKVNKPISLAGCLEIFEKAGISEEEYNKLSMVDKFKNAEKIAKEQSLSCKEAFVIF